MNYHLLLFMAAAASLATGHTPDRGQVFSTYSGTGRTPMTRKTPSPVKGGSGKQILRLDIMEAVERLQEQRPKRGSEQ